MVKKKKMPFKKGSMPMDQGEGAKQEMHDAMVAYGAPKKAGPPPPKKKAKKKGK